MPTTVETAGEKATWIRKLFSKSIQLPSPGLHHYKLDFLDGYSRVHLRINPDLTGCLVVDAAQMIHLNQIATLIAYDHLEGRDVEQITGRLYSLFNVSPEELRSDILATTSRITELIRPDGLCPVHELELDITMPFTEELTAPYRMDLALTYACNNDCHHCYNARPRTFPSLDTAGWKKVIDRVWDLAIPHIVFTGGEPTLCEDLPVLIAYAEKKGLITGINTNGRRLAINGYLDKLVDSGLDHIQITLESHLAEIHDKMVANRGAWLQTVSGIRAALATRLYVMTNTTMLKPNTPFIQGTLEFLSELGIPTIGLNSLIYSGRGVNVNNGLMESELEPFLALAKQHVEKTGQKLIWYTPTQYCQFDPVTQELGIKGCSAARYNMCVEPDGAVLPCQSYYSSLGNILTDPWDKIWHHPLSESIRSRSLLPQKCEGCAVVTECGGGCPLTYVPGQAVSN